VKTVTASEFRAKCLKLMDEVAATGAPICITKRGRPVARLIPESDPRRSILGLHAGQSRILGDIISPIDVEWEAER